MRDSHQQSSFRQAQKPGITYPSTGQQEKPFDGQEFFNSFYTANTRGRPEDRMTIGAITEMESRFHYNAVENSIIRALSKIEPPPSSAMVEAWRMLKSRQEYRLLDIGSGTGHWIDFMMDVFHVSDVVGFEFARPMFEFLSEKYSSCDNIKILDSNVVDFEFDGDLLSGLFDFITAIGVMFHIVEDDLWHDVVRNLGNKLKPSGIMIISGQFGTETCNVEFHKTDEFDSWKSFEQAEGSPDEILVNKRVRSLADWCRICQESGLSMVEVVRSERHPILTTPENDILVLRRQ